MKVDFYPYGVQYYRAPTPLPGEWEADMREISKVGYTHVQFRPQWRTHERIRGSFVWDDLDQLLELAHRNGLLVGLQLMLETAPDWVFSEMGGERTGFGNRPISPSAIGSFYVGGWMPCFDNPNVMKAAREFGRQLALRYNSHPALCFYSAWNEPRSRPLGQCQCAHSAESYRTWLKSLFGSIEELNAALGKAWTSYETLNPPSAALDYTEMYIWRQWAAFAVSEHVRLMCDEIRSTQPTVPVVAHAGGCSVVQDVACDACDDILNAKAADLYGTSFPVPLHPQTPTDHACPDLISDWLRRVDPLYWLHEFYANHGEWSAPPDPKVLKRLLWMAISGGASAFTYWQYRSERLGNETNGYGLREIDGSPNDRSHVADDIAGILKRHGAKLVDAQRVPARIALMYSRESDLLSRVTEMREMWTTNEDARGDYAYKRAIKTAHAMYTSLGETVDFVIPDDDLGRFELVHVTAAEMIDAETAENLKDYVRAGGKLIVEFPFACRDTNTWVSTTRPSHGLAELLGCVEASRTVVPGTGDSATFERGVLSVSGWVIRLEPRGAEVIATWNDGRAAATRHNYGSGIVYALGASLSLGFRDEWDNESTAILGHILTDLSVEREAPPADRVWVKRRRSATHEIWFVFNVSDSAKQIELPSPPITVWEASESTVGEGKLTLPAGAAWIAEMPLGNDERRT